MLPVAVSTAPRIHCLLSIGQALFSPQSMTLYVYVGRDFVEQGRTFPFIGVNIRGLVHYGDTKLHCNPFDPEGHRHTACCKFGL